MFVWLSPRWAQAAGIGLPCLRRDADRPLSHDYLFHSVIGLLEVRTSVYRPERDIFDVCRGDVHRAMNHGASTARAAP
jgi:lipid A ethanolaminephosphotransferase